MNYGITVIGAGLAGLSAAIACAEAGVHTRIYANAAPERAQSALAEGGINAAIDSMGEGDSTSLHFAETYESGCRIADEEAVRGLTEAAPEILWYLASLGVPFHREDGRIVQRFFGGQSKRRAAYIKSGTGKALMTALIDEIRKYERQGLIESLMPWELCGIEINRRQEAHKSCCSGVTLRSLHTGELRFERGPVIICTGGLAGFFPGRTTGSSLNDGTAAALLFSEGVRFSNLEMLQYHPTTVSIAGKRLLVTEAARGEGGRLFIRRGGKRWYFLEELYPERGNLMPRDVVSREIYRVSREAQSRGEDTQVYLDLTELPIETIDERLSELRDELQGFLGLDVHSSPIPVSAGIHYFMGGIDCDSRHRTNISGLYAAGECAGLYHGANRLGGNSLLGAIYGGRRAAKTAMSELRDTAASGAGTNGYKDERRNSRAAIGDYSTSRTASVEEKLGAILYDGLSIVRSGESIACALDRLSKMYDEYLGDQAVLQRLRLAEAMLRSAALRCESRGAHFRSDYPDTDDGKAVKTIAEYRNGEVSVCYAEGKL